MILVLGGEPMPPSLGPVPDGRSMEQVRPSGLVEALDAVRRADPQRVVACLPLPGINPFALSRALRRDDGPQLWLVGVLRRDQRFWAERCGCRVVERLEQALEGTKT